jgi:hypothetical protein
MQKFTNPLDNIRVAKPCPADWNGMFGNDRKRFCGECKLNVYNLSDMTRREAETFLLESEGRICVRYFRREDGTVLTKDCPVGLAALKRRVSKAITAVFSMFAGIFGGIIGFGLLKENPRAVAGGITVNPVNIRTVPSPPVVVPVTGKDAIQGAFVRPIEVEGKISNLNDVKGEIVVRKKATRK